VESIKGADLDLDMAITEEETRALQTAKTTAKWRAFRLAAKTKLGSFDKVDDGKNLDSLLQANGSEQGQPKGEELTDTDVAEARIDPDTGPKPAEEES
jgi:THO complex subunit 1